MALASYREGLNFERLPSGIFFNNELRAAFVDRPEPTENLGPGNSVPFPTFQASYAPAPTITKEPEVLRCLPLLEVFVDVSITSTVARSRLTQTFSNPSDIAIKEASYTFPLYDGVAVTAFRCYIGKEKTLEGRIKPKEEAKAEFNKAVVDQQAAALLEEHTPEVFETRLGNIPPWTTVKVEITYINELKADIGGEGVLLTIPTSVAPRYGTPPSGLSPDTTLGGRGLRITVDVTATIPIRKLESRTHPISFEIGAAPSSLPAPTFASLASAPTNIEYDPKKARATLSDRTATLGRDFVLLILAEGSTLLASRALLEKQPGHSAMMVTLCPKDLFSSHISMAEFSGEIIFVADRSGSMGGQKIEMLRDALAVFLKSLPERSHFNIYSFGSTFSSLWEKSQPYSQDSLDSATQHVSQCFLANMGGTELLPALQQAVHRRVDNLTTQIILLTDGEVWNTERTLQFVQQTRTVSKGAVRFFALGIGDAVSHRLVEGIGRDGGGFSEIVAIDAQGHWESRVIQMLKGALMPASWDCEVHCSGEGLATQTAPQATASVFADPSAVYPSRPTYIQAPFRIPPLHPFARSSVFSLFDNDNSSDIESITIKGVTPNHPVVYAKLIVEVCEPIFPTIHYLAAKAAMMDLESSKSWLHSSQVMNGEVPGSSSLDTSVKAEAERIGIQWSVTGKWTSFVAVEETDHVTALTRCYKPRRSELVDFTRPWGVKRADDDHLHFPNKSSLLSPIYPRSSSPHLLNVRGPPSHPKKPPTLSPPEEPFGPRKTHVYSPPPLTPSRVTFGLTYQDRTRNASAEIVSQTRRSGEVSTGLGGRFNDLINCPQEKEDERALHAPLDLQAQRQSYEYSSPIFENLPSGNVDAYERLSSTASGLSLQEHTDCARAVTVSGLIKYQDYRGAFSFGGDFDSTRAAVMAKFSSLSTAQLRETVEAKPSFSKSVIEGRSDHRLFDTLIAIAYIRTQFPESRELWELVIQKAEIYVDQFFRDKKDWEQVITWLQEMQEAPQAEAPAIKDGVVKNDMPRNNSFADLNRFPCPDTKCNITFTSRSNAIQHLRDFPDHRLRCPASRCNERFWRNYYLSRHIQRHHPEQADGLSDSAEKGQDSLAENKNDQKERDG